jgi:SprA-related family
VISNVTSTYAVSAPANYQAAGRQVVSEESTDLKLSSFRPTEQLAESSRQQTRRAPEDKPSQDNEQSRTAAKQAPIDENQQRKQKAQKDQQEAEQKMIEQLAARDREVRAHEQAHAAVGGQYAGSPTYTYQRGPDGVSYAVGGEVRIDTSPIPGDPEATLRKAEQIARAASAPADPSGQDRAVAAQAAKMAQQARIEISQKFREKIEDKPEEAADNKVEGNVEDSEKSVQVADERIDTKDTEKQKTEERQLKEQELQSQRQAERTRLLTELQQKNLKTNLRLLEINSFETASGVGRFLDKSV